MAMNDFSFSKFTLTVHMDRDVLLSTMHINNDSSLLLLPLVGLYQVFNILVNLRLKDFTLRQTFILELFFAIICMQWKEREVVQVR